MTAGTAAGAADPGTGAAGGACTPLQRRMWFLQQHIPASGPAYHVTTATRLRGEIDVAALDRAVALLADRHESLRTSFAAGDSGPVRRVAPPGTGGCDLEVRRAAEAEPTGRIDEVAMSTFDLTRAPLWRAVLLRVAPTEAVLVLCLSHAVADGWSAGIVHRELGALYDAVRAGRPARLPESDGDLTGWLDRARHRAAARHLADVGYWREELRGAPPALVLPADHPRPAVESHRGRRHRVPLPADLVDAVHRLAGRLSVTPFAVYLAGYALVLSGWSGEADLVIGTPFANRRTVADEAVVGPLMELLPLRVRLAPGTTGEGLLRDLRRRALRAIAHADLGFDGLLASLRPAREAGRHPLFQAMFLMQNAPVAPVALAGCTGAAVPVDPPTARMDLVLDLTPAGREAVATFEYPADLFEPALIARVGDRYRHLLATLTADPAAPVRSLAPVDRVERRLLRDTVNRTGRDLPGPQVLPALVDGSARRRPDAVAVETAAGRVSYAALVDRSVAAARGLVGAGVRPGHVVGVCLDRGVDQVVAQLAAMRCGAAYLPLDPAHPPARLAATCRDAGVALVLAADPAAVPADVAAPVHCLSDLDPAGGTLPAVDPAAIAYVMYTSGSTGRPKGVMVSHRSVTNLIRWAQVELPLRPEDRMLGKTTSTFDIAVWEIYGTLAAGATLVLAEPGRHRDAGYVADLLAGAGITVTHFVPSMLRGVLGVPGLRPWPRLRRVILGGEALPAELAGRLSAHCGAEVLNFYGPTEAAVYVSWHPAGDRVTATGTVPIGRPVANTTMYVLDRELRPVPLGAPGELYLGGIQIAAGYLARPGLTAARFLPDPYAAPPGARMYRTGDRVRRAGDGTVDFLGRDDGQVKLRGHRIELGEIEAALRGHEAVAAAAVEVRGPAGAEALAAHVVPATDPAPAAAELRAHLAARLPAVLVPARFRVAGELPLTSSGKLDRPALAALPLDPLPDPAGAVAPRPGAEEAVAAVWERVLGVPVTDAEADFFALGGDSISAVPVVAACARHDLPVTVADLFTHPTVAGLARVAARAAPGAAPPAEPEADPGAVRLPAPEAAAAAARYGRPEAVLGLGPMQEYAVERVRRAALPGLYVVCFTARVEGERFDVDAWRRAWRELMRRHPGLRTSFWLGRDRPPVQLVHADLPLPLRVVDLRHLDPTAARAAVAAEEAAQRGHVIDPTDTPQWSMTAFRTGGDRYRIVCRLSYLLQDGWSVSVLQDEWFALYDAYRRGAAPDLPPPAPPYATHLRQLAARDLAAGRRHWAGRLAGMPAPGAVTAALRARGEPAEEPPAHRTVSRWLSPGERAALREFARRERLTLFTPLQAAWALLLAGITGAPEVLFGTLSSGRATPEVRATYGSFNNMMPTRVAVPPEAQVADFLRELQAGGVADRAHDHVPLTVIAADAGVADPVDLLDTYLVHENFPVDPATQDRFARWRPDIAEMRTEHALRLLVWPVGELSLHLSFDSGVVSEVASRTLLDRYREILGTIAGGAAGRLSALLADPWEPRHA